MNKPNKQRDVGDVIALVNAMIEYWKEIARRNFINSDPNADMNEFEQRWPKILANFFLVETVRTAKALQVLSEGREN